MREIKFRARNADVPRCWIYGYFVAERGIHYIINDDGKFKIIVGTECLFTGLHDKNGKESFDGDLAKLSDTTYLGVYEIRFNAGRWELHSEDENGNPNTEELYPWEGKFEVIGNVRENPELLANTQASL